MGKFVQRLPEAMKMYETHTANEVAEKFGVHPVTVRAYANKLRKENINIPKKNQVKFKEIKDKFKNENQ